MRSDERRDIIITLRWRLLSPRDQENIDVASWLSRLPGRKSTQYPRKDASIQAMEVCIF